jgi:integrase
MAKRGLTALTIENLKPGPVRREIPDGKSRGLYLVLQPSGHRSWCVRYRRPQDGRPAKYTIGNGNLSLATARKLAADAMLEIEQGRDPATARETARLADARTKADTLAAIAEIYLRREAEPKLRTAGQRRNCFERLIFPALGAKPIADISRGDVVKLLDKIEDENGPRAADIALAALSRLFNWHASRSDSFRSPLVRGMQRSRPASERARTRILDDDELRRVWRAADGMGMFGAFIKFLTLTTARRDEAAAMKFSELDGTDWMLPPERHKTGKKLGALVRPLPPAALAVLAGLPRVAGCEYVFSVTGKKQIYSGWKLKRILDEQSGVRNWRLHDLRRTGRSLMSRAGVASDHAERVLGHVLPGIRGTYDRHSFYNEKKHALAALAAQIERIVEPPADVVVPLRG